MDFAILCKLLNQRYLNIKDRNILYRYLLLSYENLKIKRNKLKLGAVTFEIKPYFFNNMCLFYSFEMVFSRQPSSNSTKKTMLNIINFFEWSW